MTNPMLKEIFLINSARFDFARVRLDRDLFFLGDNGSGKTSFIRAIHFLYSGDVKSLGISNDKESFKEYYFKYENSYIIYVFESFFIFVYKRGNELHKVFSKQPFELAKITDEAGNLKPFEAIRAYLRSAPLHKRISGVSDYSDILYGLNRQYLDFKIADIRNKALFLRLFHAVFNVDKAIIDAKSIKRALMTSLQGGEEGKYFDPEAYTQRINGFMEQYRFFNQIEKESERIEELATLHERLLKREEELMRLSAKIRERKGIETARIQELGEELRTFDEQRGRASAELRSLQRFEGKLRERLDRRIDALRSELSAIEGEKRRFAPEKLQEARQRVRESAAVEEEYERLRLEKLKLQSGIESALESLEREIRALRRRIEEELPRLRQVEVEEAVRAFKEKEEKRLEAEELKFAAFEEKNSRAIEGQREEIARFESEIEEQHRRLQKAREEWQEVQEGFYEQRRLLREGWEEWQRAWRKKVEAIERERERLEDGKERLLERFAEKMAEHRAVYEEEKAAIAEERKRLEQILQVEEGSFQAFLDEEVEGWQRTLYPLLDEGLLTMPTDTLKPRILHRPIVGIELDTSQLKRMPTPEEAQERLERLGSKDAALEDRWRAKQVELEEEAAKERAKIESGIQEMEARLAHLEQESAEQEKEHEAQLAALEREKARARKSYETLQKEIGEAIGEFKTEIAEVEKRIAERLGVIARRREQLKEQRRKMRGRLDRFTAKAEAEAKAREAEKRVALEAKIGELESQKATMQTDTRLAAVTAELERVQGRLEAIHSARALLRDYEAIRSRLQKEPRLRERLLQIQSRQKRCLERIAGRRREMQEEMERLKGRIEGAGEELNRIEKGLKRLNEITLYGPKEARETAEEELVELIERLERSAVVYEKERNRIVGLLQKLAKIKGLAKQDIHLDATLAENADTWSELAPLHLQIENLIELKRFRIDTLKREANAIFSNFVKNLINQQLTVFSNTQEAFESLVAKVNTQLRQVDFGVIRQIRLRTRIEEGDSLAKMFERLKSESDEIASLMVQDSLFFDRRDALKRLERLLELFAEIKKQLKSDRISLVDTIDLSLEFYENGVLKSGVTQIKNESSTGGSMLLKIAIAIAILKVYIKNAENIFFLIVDEVARLHSENQRRLKNFANESGFRIIFVTPEPVFADPKELLYYKFEKRGEKFRVIALNR